MTGVGLKPRTMLHQGFGGILRVMQSRQLT